MACCTTISYSRDSVLVLIELVLFMFRWTVQLAEVSRIRRYRKSSDSNRINRPKLLLDLCAAEDRDHSNDFGSNEQLDIIRHGVDRHGVIGHGVIGHVVIGYVVIEHGVVGHDVIGHGVHVTGCCGQGWDDRLHLWRHVWQDLVVGSGWRL